MAIAIYYRVSTTKQEADAQRHEIAEWVKTKGYPVEELVEFSDKGISGATSARSGFKQLLKAIDQGQITKLITFEMSRLSRDFMTFLKVLELCQKKGVEIEVPGGDDKAFATSKDKLLRAVEAFMASQEREDIGKRISAGMQNAKAKGVKLGAKKGEKRKLGYRKDYLRDPKDHEIAMRVVKLSRDGLSTYKIADILDLTQSKVIRILKRSMQ